MSSSEQAQHAAGMAARTAKATTRPSATAADGSTRAPGQPRPSSGLPDKGSREAQQRSAADTRPPSPAPVAPRRVRLTVARLDPWSVMKLSFLLSVAIGIALVVAAAVLWTILDGMGVYADVNRVSSEILGKPFDVLDYIGLSKVMSLATVIAVVDVVLITALSTLGAFLYNMASSLVGGLHVTLSDD